MTPLLAGLGLGFSLIVAIGAQNLFVLRQGIRREHVAMVAAICTVSDMTLIVLGISGVGAATHAWPWLESVVRWAGAAFLVGYGVLAARRAIWPAEGGLSSGDTDEADSSAPIASGGSVNTLKRTTERAAAVALTTLALTWLNPHVYLDTVFLLGSVGAAQGDARWVFATGAMIASTTWFFGLAYGARFLGRWLSGPRAWRYLDAAIAVVMVTIGISLVWPGV